MYLALHANNNRFFIYSTPVILQRGDNVIPGLDGEIISIKKSFMCYQIRSKSKQFKSILGEDKTFTIEFYSKNLDFSKTHNANKRDVMPTRAIFYATSFENSFGVESSEFYYGNPQIIEILLNHHSIVELKPKQYHLIKEKSGCVEKTKYQIWEEIFAKSVLDMCPNPCTLLLMPNETFPICEFGIHSEYDWKCSSQILYDLEGKYENFAPLCSRTDYEGYFIEDNEPIKGLPTLYSWISHDFHDNEVRSPDFINHAHGTDLGYNPIVKMSYRFLNLNSLQPNIHKRYV